MDYLQLVQLAESEDVEIIEMPMNGRNKGLYCDNVIALSSHVETTVETRCILAEELGHHYTSFGDITDQSRVENRKQEIKARRWGYSKLVPIKKLIQAYEYGCTGRHEVAEYIGVTEIFLEDSIEYYLQKYGVCAPYGKYIIYFNPLGVMDIF